jgi:hypothetical protein
MAEVRPFMRISSANTIGGRFDCLDLIEGYLRGGQVDRLACIRYLNESESGITSIFVRLMSLIDHALEFVDFARHPDRIGREFLVLLLEEANLRTVTLGNPPFVD